MSSPPPIPQRPLVNTAHLSRPSFAKQAATFSLVAPFVGMGVMIFSQPTVEGNRAGMLIVACTAILLILAGFAFGVVALMRSKMHGKRGIFGKAVAGVCINGLLIAWMLISIPGVVRASERAKEIHRQRLQQQPQP